MTERPDLFTPTDVADDDALSALWSLLTQKDQQLSDHQHTIQSQHQQIQSQAKLIQLLEEKLRLAQLKRFAASSEKMPYQIDFFDEAELEVALSDLEQAEGEGEDKPSSKRKKAPREGYSEDLPRERIEMRLTEAEKAGAERTYFSKVKEELDIVPAKARVLEYWQEKAVFPETDEGSQPMIAAERPVHPLGKCLASVALLAFILVSKYADALPLYRLEGILQRYGAHISRTSLAHWMIRLGEEVFPPLMALLQQHQRKADYLQADETRMPVLKEPGKTAQSDKWMWLIRGGPPNNPVVLFHYDASRREAVPSGLLDGFQGHLQVDGYAGYNEICRQPGVTRVGCMDHVRRKFVEASKAAPAAKKRSKQAKVSKADSALSHINALYRIEKTLVDLSPEERQAKRQSLIKPRLDDFKTWLDKNQRKVPKDGLTYKAIQYALNQWPTLTVFCEHGHVHISNVLAENAIRPLAVGRRNWLFADTPRGAQASASCYSLIETAKANGLEPQSYIAHVLRHIGTANSQEKLEMLLPWNVKSTLTENQ
jgi:transposase